MEPAKLYSNHYSPYMIDPKPLVSGLSLQEAAVVKRPQEPLKMSSGALCIGFSGLGFIGVGVWGLGV